MQPISKLALYPFLHDAKEYIKERNLTVQELLQGKLYERARMIAIERLDNALKQGDVQDRQLATKTDLNMEIFSYPLSRMLTSGINDPYMTRRYALSEAYHAYRHLKNESNEFIQQIASELNINFQEHSNQFIKVHFKDYLRHAPTQYKKWKMVNRNMDNGLLLISYKDLRRLILEALRTKFITELNQLQSNQLINQTFSSEIARFRTILHSKKKQHELTPIGKLNIEKLPPCLKDILTAIQAGENVSHMGRFTLVSFLGSIGMNTNEILKLFSSAPDYQEERTRYQVEHITGTSSSTTYKSPGCGKMRTYGLCPTDKMDELCRSSYHPLKYYYRQWKKNNNTGGHDK